MQKEIVVDINPYQTRVVLLENGAPGEIYIERRGKERLVGNIYNGRVQNVLPGMQAAFVDIGLERNAFLFARDILFDKSDFQFDGGAGDIKDDVPNIKDIVKPGQEILVQVTKEPVGSKGARVTTHITLPGRTLVLMPSVNYIGVSRRIEDEDERARLKACIEAVKPASMGAIVRTAAVGKSEEEFAEDMAFLARLWERILQKSKLLSAPRLVHAEETLIFRTIRDLFTADVDKLVINDREFYEKIKAVASIISPALKDRVELYEGATPLFDVYKLESVIDKALARKVWMKNGGHIIIDQTEALTTIDVNTGKFIGNDNLQETITETNCEAAREIARQLRLRDISGIIIIDFIDMEEIGNKEKVLETLRAELRQDRTKSNVLGITQLGLVEMTRKKTRQCISNTLQAPCPYCGGDGKVLSRETVLLKVRKKLLRAFAEETHANYLVRMHPTVAQILEENNTDEAPLLPRAPGRAIWVQTSDQMHVEEFSITPLTSGKELKSIECTAQRY
ncbi:MAG: Rne/Rng family ribonuclease [Christensenellaceae bacterium]|jgi:ribonuclease G|nr:Rne/Rng family ribonuclease [Christensenellaceae bacterium]